MLRTLKLHFHLLYLFFSNIYHRFVMFLIVQLICKKGWVESLISEPVRLLLQRCNTCRFAVCLETREAFITAIWGYLKTSYFSDLAMMLTEPEARDLWTVKGPHRVWIGMYREPWRWSDNRNSSFKNWGDGQPNNHLAVQYCVFLNLDYTWGDADCTKMNLLNVQAQSQ
uniref:C-type lectin domain-containing protein n=1 Tax=Labrus bergylta TaxID=56723 RepID=A0A3Q3EL18_9LABR